MRTAPPTWFTSPLHDLKRQGFFAAFDLDEYHIDDLWGMWEERWEDRPARPTMISRLLSLDDKRVCLLDVAPFMSQWDGAYSETFAALSRISMGALKVHSVKEQCAGQGVATISVHANDHRVDFQQQIQDSKLDPSLVVKAANVLLTRGSFRLLLDEDDDARCVYLQSDHGRSLLELGAQLAALEAEHPPRSGLKGFLQRLLPKEQPIFVCVPAPAPAEPKQSMAVPAMTASNPCSSQHYEEIARVAAKQLEPFRKDVWIPLVVAGESDDVPTKFGGRPWMPAEARSPKCPTCRTDMVLGVQLDLHLLPEKKKGLGLLQYFLCPECLCEDDGFVIRVLERDGCRPSGVKETLPARTIRDWKRRDELPQQCEWKHLGIELCDEEELLLAEYIDEPEESDKLGGWAHWIQGSDLPRCPVCEQKMELFMQIDSEHHLDVMFGDCGKMYIASCPDHPYEFEGWVEYH